MEIVTTGKLSNSISLMVVDYDPLLEYDTLERLLGEPS